MTRDEFRAWLRARKITQKAAAPMLGVSEQTVSNWVVGRHPIPPTIVKLIECLDRTPHEGG